MCGVFRRTIQDENRFEFFMFFRNLLPFCPFVPLFLRILPRLNRKDDLHMLSHNRIGLSSTCCGSLCRTAAAFSLYRGVPPHVNNRYRRSPFFPPAHAIIPFYNLYRIFRIVFAKFQNTFRQRRRAYRRKICLRRDFQLNQLLSPLFQV